MSDKKKDDLWNQKFDEDSGQSMSSAAPESDSATPENPESATKADSVNSAQSADEKATPVSSRQAYQKKKHRSRGLVALLTGVVVLLAAASVFGYMQHRSDFMDSSEVSKPTVAVSQKDKKSKSISESKEKKAADSSRSAAKEANSKSRAKQQSELSKQRSVSRETEKNNSSVSSSSTSVNSQSESTSEVSSTSPNSASSSADVSASSSAQNAGGQYATVQAGQGLYRTAVNNGITVQELMQMNGLTSSSELHPGQQLRVK